MLEVIFLCGVVLLLFVLVWVLVSVGLCLLVLCCWGLYLLCGVLGMVMIGCFVFVLCDLLLFIVYIIYFVVLLLIVVLLVLLLGEWVGLWCWVVIGIGLVGVLVVLWLGVDGFILVLGLMVLVVVIVYVIVVIMVSLLICIDIL